MLRLSSSCPSLFMAPVLANRSGSFLTPSFRPVALRRSMLDPSAPLPRRARCRTCRGSTSSSSRTRTTIILTMRASSSCGKRGEGRHKPRFIVPLGNKAWFASLGLGIDDENVVELDWWDEVWLAWSDTGAASLSSTGDITREEPHLRLICTPAQHGSGRYGLDSSTTLWSSWTLEHHFDARSEPLRVFFGGDTATSSMARLPT
ncbi:hypothetical protein L7F22_040101 [Adiantum nelumboides]|nr:hypothetical protein [Adiantum nelumboides]